MRVHAVLLVVLMVCLTTIFGCSSDPSASLYAVSGDVTQGIHIPMTSMGSPMPSWCVSFDVKNISSSTKHISSVHVIWAAAGASGLQSMIMPPQDPGEWVLEPGSTKSFEVDSDGWTQDILGGAEGKHVMFQIIVMHTGNDAPIGYLAILPDLGNLPQHELVLMDRAKGKDTRGAPLVFTAVPLE